MLNAVNMLFRLKFPVVICILDRCQKTDNAELLMLDE